MDGEVLTIVSNNSNFIKGADNAPVLISWTDATTLFHEFGHAFMDCLQMLLIRLCRYCRCQGLCGISSQILRWLETPEVLNKFALHYKTNEPIPMALVERIEASTFNDFSTVETIASSLIDMKLHLAGDTQLTRQHLSVKH
jgi:peptidyl-dipeptidase Dcp